MNAERGEYEQEQEQEQDWLQAKAVSRSVAMPPPIFTGLPFFVYPVTDMARARAFYEGVLGLKVTANWENKFVEFDVGAGTLALSTIMEGCTPGARGGAAAMETPHLDAAVAHLKAHGVVFVFGPADTGVCHFARFLDPDGNHLGLHRKHTDWEGESISQ